MPTEKHQPLLHMKKNHQIKQTIRFRYFARKGYAAFLSLGRCITIGRVRKNVTERALTKQTDPVALSPFAVPTVADAAASSSSLLPTDTVVLLLLAALCPPLQTTYAAPHGSHSPNINSGIDARNASCNSMKPSLRKAGLQDAFRASIPLYTPTL